MENIMDFLALLLIIALVVTAQGQIYKHFSMRHLDYSCRLSADEVYEGDEIELIETLSNKKWLPIPWLKVEITTSRWLDFAGSQSIVTSETRYVPSFFLMKSYHKVTRRWKVSCLRRGEHRIEKAVLVGTDLLGSGSYSKPTTVDSGVMVLPKIPDLAEIFISPNHMVGEMVVRRHLISDPFLIAGVREYADGDAMNQIHWSATARQQTLMVRNQDYTSSQSLLVLMNMQTRRDENCQVIDRSLAELAIHTCAAYFDQTIQSGIPVGFMCNSSLDGSDTPIITNTFWGPEHVNDLLRLLARLPFWCTGIFDKFLLEHGKTIQATDIVLITSYVSDQIMEFIRAKQMNGIHVKLIIVNNIPDEEIPGECEVYCLRDEIKEALQKVLGRDLSY